MKKTYSLNFSKIEAKKLSEDIRKEFLKKQLYESDERY